MLLIAEIWLTVVAWRKGWKGWALLPIGTGILAAVICISATGIEAFSPVLMLFDLAAIVILTVMVAKKRNPNPEKIRVATVPADNTSFYCPRCGSSQIAGNSYCGNCGQEFGTWAS